MLALLWPRSGRERNYYLAAYTFVLFALGTIFMGMNGYWLGRCFIDNRNFPGGPEAYANAMYSTAVPLATNSTFIIANWLADALMVSSSMITIFWFMPNSQLSSCSDAK